MVRSFRFAILLIDKYLRGFCGLDSETAKWSSTSPIAPRILSNKVSKTFYTYFGHPLPNVPGCVRVASSTAVRVVVYREVSNEYFRYFQALRAVS